MARPSDGSAPPVDVDEYRRAAGRFASGVCVVSTRLRGHDHAITLSSFASVSLDPVLVLVCVHADARFYDAVEETGTWGLSVLAARARPAATWLATPGRPVVDQLARVPHRRGPLTGAALLEESVATMECATEAEHPAGTHVVLVGRVLGVSLAPEDERPLLHHRGAYAEL
ncbi:flavin reductase family protein [Pseudokineococcus marinus]|uniref:Flavin reductase n=1 Tax=Pseudokineococcus marinus TaxID=351215 RepID=A0A849BP40_9ACTN|nr:flavin reductase family protein [Pseudokineococcus marinus]NNH23205.1 flavin reductase [Pseudokineococcus marinus]